MTGNLMKNAEQKIQACRSELSIIVPMLNELDTLPDLMAHLQQWQRLGCEVLLVDGGSDDGSADIAEAIGFKVIRSARGRALQMNAGAAAAKGSILLFLHADTRLPEDGLEHILGALKKHRWGRFNVHISGEARMLRVVAFFINLRSRLTNIATGDQALFIEKTLFDKVHGFPAQPLMEDIELSKRLRYFERPACLSAKVITSGRRWIKCGIWRTIRLMWILRWAYWRGVPAEQLVKRYYKAENNEKTP